MWRCFQFYGTQKKVNMPITYFQTAVRLDKSQSNSEPTYQLSCAPIKPTNKNKVYYEDGSYTQWEKGETYHVTPEHIWTIWYEKPTLAEAVKPQNMACYFEFHKDGSVKQRYKDEGHLMEFYWSAPIEGTEVEYNEEYEPDFVKCRACGSNAEGSDWEVYELCSRDCMKSTIGYDSWD